MRHLSDTITRLAALRASKETVSANLPASRLVPFRDFGDNPGALAAKIYAPVALQLNAPLVVVLHGCTQTANGYDHGVGWTDMADKHGFVVLFPEQQRANNPNLCFNWFTHEDSRRNSGEPLSIRNMIGAAISRFELDPDRVFINGLSAGGAMTSVMLATYPEVFAGGAIFAGLPFGIATSVPEAFDRMRGVGIPSKANLQSLVRDATDHEGRWPTISVWHGDEDQTVSAINAEAIVSQWRDVHELTSTSPSTVSTAYGTKRSWFGARNSPLVEEHRIAGMGHGTPIDAGRETAQVHAGPFVLDVGVPSTEMLCRSWRLTQLVAASSTATKHRAQYVKPARDEHSGSPGHSESQLQVSSDIGLVIERALRAAGLMR